MKKGCPRLSSSICDAIAKERTPLLKTTAYFIVVMTDNEAHLCRTCRHARTVETERSTFLLCRRSESDPTYPKYPYVPILACEGYESSEPSADSPSP